MDEHIIEAIGKAKIVIKDGKVVEVGEPEIDYCPLFHKHRNMETLTKEAIKDNIEFRIKDFGMCTPQREIKMKDFLSFGISETISTLLKENIIDCAIMVCEGCGTVIIDNSETAQGVGGRVSGLVKTSPIPEIIEKIGKDKVINPENAAVQQVKGIELAIDEGYKNIAVTVAGTEDLNEIKKINNSIEDVNIYVFGVHTTGLSEEDAIELINNCDVITACASKYVWEICEKEAIFKVGESIPIYAMTPKGKEFMELRLEKIGGKQPKKDNPRHPQPLI